MLVRRATTVSPGDLVDVFDGESKKWTQSTVLSNGTKPGTFILVAQDVRYLYDVPAGGRSQGRRARRHPHREHPPEGGAGRVP